MCSKAIKFRFGHSVVYSVKFIPQNFEAIAELQAELCLVKFGKFDTYKTLFANLVPNYVYRAACKDYVPEVYLQQGLAGHRPC